MAKKVPSITNAGYASPAGTRYRSVLRGGVDNQASKGAPRPVPSGIMSKDQYTPGKPVAQQVGWMAGKWTAPVLANTNRVDPNSINPCKVKPSGSTITR